MLSKSNSANSANIYRPAQPAGQPIAGNAHKGDSKTEGPASPPANTDLTGRRMSLLASSLSEGCQVTFPPPGRVYPLHAIGEDSEPESPRERKTPPSTPPASAGSDIDDGLGVGWDDHQDAESAVTFHLPARASVLPVPPQSANPSPPPVKGPEEISLHPLPQFDPPGGRWARFREHLSENRAAYLGAAAGVGLGAGLFATGLGRLASGSDDDPDLQVNGGLMFIGAIASFLAGAAGYQLGRGLDAARDAGFSLRDAVVQSLR